MNKFKKDLSIILNNQRGIALMMIMTSIILLMAIYGEFTFESKISRIKATNIMDRSQAKLLAESGLQLAMARLKLYKEAFNKLEQNSSAKQSVPPQLVNQLWEVPFIYPIPMTKDAPVTMKSTVETFQKETILDGEMKVTIQNISSRINLNMLRIDELKNIQQKALNPDADPDQDLEAMYRSNDNSNSNTEVNLYTTFLMSLKRTIENKTNKDEEARDRFSNFETADLINDLVYFTSDINPNQAPPYLSEAASHYQKGEMTAKHGPLGSVSELYSLYSWNDEIVEMVQNEFSVHPTVQIDINKMTANMLKIIIPSITEDQIKSFFEYRDDPESPKFFKTTDDLKRWVVDVERIMPETNFNDRIENFKSKGISFGSNPNLFKVISEGTYNRSTFTLVAYVQIPKQETAPTNNPNSGKNPNRDSNTSDTTSDSSNSNSTTDKQPDQPTQLLEPRIIEIQVN